MQQITKLITLPAIRSTQPVLGVGAFLKNTLCLIQGDEAWISEDIGSLDNAETIGRFEQTANTMIASAKKKPVAVAHDLHPDFASTRFALTCGLKAAPVQHHHAHIAAIMAEHGMDEPVLGLALDGFGLGLNGEAWGGELLRVDAAGFTRLGHLHPLPQPGGDSAAHQPWRMGAAALWAMGRGQEIESRYKDFPNAAVLKTMMDRGINSPMTTSAGRLFDAACGLLNIKPIAAFEGEAPMALEGLVSDIAVDPQSWHIAQNFPKELPVPLLSKEGVQNALTSPIVLDLRPLLERLVDKDARYGAELFHGSLIAALSAWVDKAVEQTGIRAVALGGGCFYNKILREGLCQRLKDKTLTPLLPSKLPAGDPAISLGQAWAAALACK
jgi:hydrogenase maturation protein HypF